MRGLKFDRLIHGESNDDFNHRFGQKTSWSFVWDGPFLPNPSNPAVIDVQITRVPATRLEILKPDRVSNVFVITVCFLSIGNLNFALTFLYH